MTLDENAPCYAVSFPGGGGKTQISTAGGEQPRWRGDGKELFYVAADGKMTAVAVHAGAGATPSIEASVPVNATRSPARAGDCGVLAIGGAVSIRDSVCAGKSGWCGFSDYGDC